MRLIFNFLIGILWVIPFFGMEQVKAKDILIKKVGWKKPHEVAELIKDKNNKVVLASCYSPDGKMVAATEGNYIEIWNTAAPYQSECKIKMVSSCIGATYNYDGTIIAGFFDGVNLFNVETGQNTQRFEGNYCWAEYNPKNNNEIAGVANPAFTNSNIIWDTISGQKITEFPSDEGISGGHYHPSGKSFAVFNEKCIKIWDFAAGKYQIIINPSDPINLGGWGSNPVAFNHAGTQIAAGTTKNRIYLYDPATGKNTVVMNAFGQWLSKYDCSGKAGFESDWLSYSPDDKTLLMAIEAEDSSSIGFADPNNKNEPHSVLAFSGGAIPLIYSLQFNKDATQIQALSGNEELTLWDIPQGDFKKAALIKTLVQSANKEKEDDPNRWGVSKEELEELNRKFIEENFNESLRASSVQSADQTKSGCVVL